MDAELVAILQNIKSLADQASTMQGGSAEKADPETSQPAGQADLPPEIAEKVLKYLKEMDQKPEDEVEMSEDNDEDDVMKSAEGPTGDFSAEERIDETTDVNEKNINEVAKSIARMLAGKSAPKKVVAKSSNEAKIAKALEFIVGELQVQKEFNVNVLKGLGIADSILEAEKVEKAQKAKPRMESPQEVAKSLEMIRQMLGVATQPDNAVSSVKGADHTIAKSLAENGGSVLMGMFPKSKR